MKKKYIFFLTVLAMISCNQTEKTTNIRYVDNKEVIPVTPKDKFTLVSDDFENGKLIPAEFSCDGKNIPPSLRWSNVPEGTKSFVLTVKDPDAPFGTFTHWIVINIPQNIREIKKDEINSFGYTQLKNDFGNIGYGGPCPPSGTHRYVFTLYAIDIEKLDANPKNIDRIIDEHTISKAEIIGLYKRR
ncbi:MAG: YbhB/YbcL family Raf kinase inhibitor-like protein [Elusimicrobiales bacterium]|jgi:Raf kinase inhibitor-like YbhB/YbcL family protein|nr:YbhB/YbcL family Raf kinase inhibitor-like protein [Elusimicrobiales bacterium]